MSALICTPYHISRLAVYATTSQNGCSVSVYHNGEVIQLTDAEDVANILYEQNMASVNWLYRGNDEPSFVFDERARGLLQHRPVEIIKAARCYEYQACETEDYEATLAHKIVRLIINRAIGQLPGYEAAEWGLSEPTPVYRSPSPAFKDGGWE